MSGLVSISAFEIDQSRLLTLGLVIIISFF